MSTARLLWTRGSKALRARGCWPWARTSGDFQPGKPPPAACRSSARAALPRPILPAKLMPTWAGNAVEWLPATPAADAGTIPVDTWVRSGAAPAPSWEEGRGLCQGAGEDRGEAWQERGRGPDSVPGESQRALPACSSAFLPTRFPGSADLLFDSCFLFTDPLDARQLPPAAGSPEGLFVGEDSDLCPLFLAGDQP